MDADELRTLIRDLSAVTRLARGFPLRVPVIRTDFPVRSPRTPRGCPGRPARPVGLPLRVPVIRTDSPVCSPRTPRGCPGRPARPGGTPSPGPCDPHGFPGPLLRTRPRLSLARDAVTRAASGGRSVAGRAGPLAEVSERSRAAQQVGRFHQAGQLVGSDEGHPSGSAPAVPVAPRAAATRSLASLRSPGGAPRAACRPPRSASRALQCLGTPGHARGPTGSSPDSRATRGSSGATATRRASSSYEVVPDPGERFRYNAPTCSRGVASLWSFRPTTRRS
jgi:hypothetical protein